MKLCADAIGSILLLTIMSIVEFPILFGICFAIVFYLLINGLIHKFLYMCLEMYIRYNRMISCIGIFYATHMFYTYIETGCLINENNYCFELWRNIKYNFMNNIMFLILSDIILREISLWYD